MDNLIKSDVKIFKNGFMSLYDDYCIVCIDNAEDEFVKRLACEVTSRRKFGWSYQLLKLQGTNYSRQKFSLIKWGGTEGNSRYLYELKKRLTTINLHHINILYNFSLDILDCGQRIDKYTFFYKSCTLRHGEHDINVDFNIEDLVLAYRLSRLRWDSHDIVIKKFELICKNKIFNIIGLNEFEIYELILQTNSEWWSFRTELDDINHREVNGVFIIYEDPYITREDSFSILLREAV